MNAIDIIDRYYGSQPQLRELLLTHSRCVAQYARLIASMYAVAHADEIESGTLKAPDLDLIETGAMLHDIGILACHAPGIHCYGDAHYICHGTIGAEMLRREAEQAGEADARLLEACARICERHTGSGLTAEDIVEQRLPLPAVDLLPETIEEKIICYADKFYSKSGDPTDFKDSDRVDRSMAKFSEASARRWSALKSAVK